MQHIKGEPRIPATPLTAAPPEGNTAPPVKKATGCNEKTGLCFTTESYVYEPWRG